MLGKLSTMVAYRIIPVYVHVVRPSFAFSVQLLSIDLWLPQGAINTPILGLHMEATKQVFRSKYIIFTSTLEWTLGSAATTIHWQLFFGSSHDYKQHE